MKTPFAHLTFSHNNLDEWGSLIASLSGEKCHALEKYDGN